MFCKWYESKKYTNELAKGTTNYRKQSIDRHLNHHEHKAEVNARKNPNISIAATFSRQLDLHKIKVYHKCNAYILRQKNIWHFLFILIYIN